MKTEIIYEDQSILVIYKPAGLATQTAHVGQPDVVSELKNHIRGQQAEKSKRAGVTNLSEKSQRAGATKPVYLGVVHRLDQPVEGLLVFGKNEKAAGRLSAQLNQGTLQKEYLAVVWGSMPEAEGMLTDTLARKHLDSGAKAMIDRDGGSAILRYHVLSQKNEPEKITLLKVCIDTGRFHQIRAQLAHAGVPILGDAKYGSEASVASSGSMGIRTPALCACALSLMHPDSGKKMEFQIPPRGKAFSFFEQT